MKVTKLALGFFLSACAASFPVHAIDDVAETVPCSARGPALCPIADQPGLPRVLLIGDSISIGYTLPVRQLLANTANVHRIPQNGGSTKIGLINLDQWLGGGKWDVIHVNFGLHDAKFGPGDTPAVDLDTYTQNVRTIIKRLKSTGAHVIWATTTPVPPVIAPPPRKWGDITAYNRAALKVASEEGVSIDDLYAVVKPHETEFQRAENVHFNASGSAALARSVATSITGQLHSK